MHLNNFIHLGEGAADIVQDIITSISKNNINKAMDIVFTSKDDNRVKHLVVVENSSYENINYRFQLTITDKLFEGNADKGKALQVFWNTNPIKGVAILKPYNCDIYKNAESGNAIIRVDYSEEASINYDTQMTVYISNLPMKDSLTNVFTMKSLKMFVGKKGNYIDVFGNSVHPNASFVNKDKGFDWAFVASGNETLNIGAAEVGLPRYNLSSVNRKELLELNSIKSVFTYQINDVFKGISPALVDAYLYNTTAPGYFNNGGFIKGETSPSAEHTTLYKRTATLCPYNPVDINSLSI